MTSDDAAPDEGADGGVPALQRPYVRFSAAVAREVCRRLAAGETQKGICADPAMPALSTVYRWSRERAAFMRALVRARALGASVAGARIYGFSPTAANEIVARVSEGEMLTLICADPHLPSLRTVIRWREDNPDFAEDLRQARAGLAERLSDLGWRMALEATPETAYLTRVRLGQLRWTAAVLGPRTHGRLKPTAAPEPPDVRTICFRHFEIEEHPETGQHRVVGYTPDPETMLPVRSSEGAWADPIFTVRHPAGYWTHTRTRPGPGVEVWEDRPRRGAGEADVALPGVAGPAAPPPDDPEGWC
jgi:hypothetical protein